MRLEVGHRELAHRIQQAIRQLALERGDVEASDTEGGPRGLARGLGLPLLYDDEGCADLSPLAAQARPPNPFPLLSAKRKLSLAI